MSTDTTPTMSTTTDTLPPLTEDPFMPRMEAGMRILRMEYHQATRTLRKAEMEDASVVSDAAIKVLDDAEYVARLKAEIAERLGHLVGMRDITPLEALNTLLNLTTI